MPAEIDKLNPEDKDILLRAPAVVAILAAISDDGEVSKHEKAESIKISHLRTFTSEEMLRNFYTEAEKVFEKNFDDIMSKLPEEWTDKEDYLEAEITELNKVLPKLNRVYAEGLVNSLKSFARFVFKSNSSFLDYFVLPVFMNKVEKESFNPKIGE
jgi:hypothetical protein